MLKSISSIQVNNVCRYGARSSNPVRNHNNINRLPELFSRRKTYGRTVVQGRLGRRCVAITNTSTVAGADADERDKQSDAFMEMFDRAQSPIGSVQRAEAALAVVNSMLKGPDSGSGSEARVTRVAPPPAGPARPLPPKGPQPKGLRKSKLSPSKLKPTSDSPASQDKASPPSYQVTASFDDLFPESGTPSPSRTAHLSSLPSSSRSSSRPSSTSSSDYPSSSSSYSSAPESGASPGSDAGGGGDFWSWVPPERQQKTQEQSQPSMMTALMERTEQSLPPLQSVVQFEELFSQPSVEAPAPNLAAPSLSLEDEANSELRKAEVELAMAAVSVGSLQAGTTEGTNAATGTRMWQESGEEELEGGRLMRWTRVRGQSANGAVEWEEKWWETSDAWGYRELGAEKSGRDSAGSVWTEKWSESLTQDAATGMSQVMRTATKWSQKAGGEQWFENWNEDFASDGKTDKTAYKWAKRADGEEPPPGHASVWHERWGESWDGKGGATKWTDRWAERFSFGMEGAKKWGEKWEQKFGYGGGDDQGSKQGEAWSQNQGEAPYSRTWGERHLGGGNVHKFGKSSTGDHWDHTEHEDTWYEKEPNTGWDHAVNHSKELLNVPLRRRDGKGLVKNQSIAWRDPNTPKPPE